jgi:integrase
MTSPLAANHYKIYPRPNMPACDNFFWMLVWIKWLQSFHYGRTLQLNDFIFPAMSANGVVHPGQPISHDTVQKWINESTAGAGIRGNFSTHCFRRGGAQYWFMFAPVGQRWTLAKVRWWGGWADGEQVCLVFL